MNRFNAGKGVTPHPSQDSSAITVITPHATLANVAGASVDLVGNRGNRLEARTSAMP
jgi:hypothetical protein